MRAVAYLALWFLGLTVRGSPCGSAPVDELSARNQNPPPFSHDLSPAQPLTRNPPTLDAPSPITETQTQASSSPQALNVAPIEIEQTVRVVNNPINSAPADPAIKIIEPPQQQLIANLQVPSVLVPKTSSPSSNFPVDFVYTWYDSTDQTLRAKFDEMAANVDRNSLPPDSLRPIRYTDVGELKYSLRSVALNAPWVRSVIIIMADSSSPPYWLNSAHPQIRIVRHSEILPSSALPTFNSHAIESVLHHIPNLSEQFVYFNDDMFVYQPVSRTVFFSDDGVGNVWPGFTGKFEGSGSHEKAVHNSLTALKQQGLFSKWPSDHNLFHQAKALRVSAMLRAEQAFASAIENTQNKPFRSNTDVWAVLLSSVLCINDGACRKASPPESSFNVLGQWDSPPIKSMIEGIRTYRPTLVCINDSTNDLADELRQQLELLFPTKSMFEI